MQISWHSQAKGTPPQKKNPTIQWGLDPRDMYV